MKTPRIFRKKSAKKPVLIATIVTGVAAIAGVACSIVKRVRKS